MHTKLSVKPRLFISLSACSETPPPRTVLDGETPPYPRGCSRAVQCPTTPGPDVNPDSREKARTPGAAGNTTPLPKGLPGPTFHCQPHSPQNLGFHEGRAARSPCPQQPPNTEGVLASPMETAPQVSPSLLLPLEHTGMDTQSCSSFLSFARL